jgi:hypothetical protein
MVPFLARTQRARANIFLNRPSSGEQIEDEHDDGEDQENVYPAPEGIAADHAKQPQYEQYDGDRPKHSFFSSNLTRQFLLP